MAVVPNITVLSVSAKFVPVITTVAPLGPTSGDVAVIFGDPVGGAGDGTTNGSLLEIPKLAFITVTILIPGTASVGTVNVIEVPLEERPEMDLVPKLTVLSAGEKPVPVIVTDVPTAPYAGVKRVTVGAPPETVVKVTEAVVTFLATKSTTTLAL
ncbi:MAG: hypothetical protein A3C11_03220 [Candidatus Sungbacteria bacterium RIFCSPHIGHO2_02_FULL_49_12]|uniref:Uncharacterized protein n=2 Tax=Parcubacteria group TaxID=1794811 RepID=A0A1G2CHM0_9BACT|nr:MAG: hypothetical protein A2945_05400 [Candidatus Liptonbacteria bacterium RIFCSPLOWO2_01_FULL_52_25]OHA00427.1 MAG: hypothetical protein A3C11_03220 [Candidatus Sungbacteria bacterium RIFCSPHIGHO2_02_FULL_49_12]